MTESTADFLTIATSAIGRDGWRQFRPIAVARAADVAPQPFAATFPDAVAVATALMDLADAAMLADGAGADLLTEPPRDRLFDALMRRIDALTPHRAAVAAALNPRTACPIVALRLAPRALRAMSLALDAAGLRPDPVRAALLLRVDLTAARRIYAGGADGGAADDAAVMAALDKALKAAPERLFAA